MKKLKIVLSVLALGLLILCGSLMNSSFNAADLGSIHVEVVDLDKTIISQKEISYEEGDTLVSLIKENFDNVTFDNGMLMSIETLETPEDFSKFICIYVDDKMSEVGIEDIKYTDGTKISLILTEFNYGY